ncbi:carbonic anhydrase [Thozetella sp. PMI_491]|nr:carbonic anhydrase [Thozetella sp. PMI_491]
MASKSPARITVERLLANNKEYAASVHKAVPPLLQLVGNDMKTNGPHVVILSCLDSRANPYEVLGLKPLECIVFRNVSGRIAPVLPHIAALDAFFHINQIIILHHNNCGATHWTLEHELHDLKSKCPDATPQDLEEVRKFCPAREDNDSGLKEDLKMLRACRYIRKDIVEGAIGLYMDVQTGLVREV